MEGNLEKMSGQDQERVQELVEQLRGIFFDLNHPRNKEISELIVEAADQNPSWRDSAAWHRLIGSSLAPDKEYSFDTPDGSVSRFIKELSDKFLS